MTDPHRTHRSRTIALCLAVVFAVSVVPSAAGAAPSAVDDARKRHERAKDDLESLRTDLVDRMTQYVRLGIRIDQARQEIVQTNAKIAQKDATLVSAKDAVERRAIQLYRGDRLGMLEILLGAADIQDLMARLDFCLIVSRRDKTLVDEVRMARAEDLWLQDYLTQRIDSMKALQIEADAQREQLEADIDAQESHIKELGSDLALLLRARTFTGGTAPSGGFDPDFVMDEAVFRDSSSMNAQEIQKFLEQQPGSLARYRTADHTGRVTSPAEMIAEAATARGINPKVILAILQKEQSLLAKGNPTQRSLDWAMGCGKTDSRTFTKYKGFGKQIWFGAERLVENARPWRAGITLRIDGNTVYPANSATYSLYKYTPHFRGTMSFWMLYWRYFGDPKSMPSAQDPTSSSESTESPAFTLP